VPLISDGEYQYEYNDFLKSVGALDTSKSSGYSFDNDPAPPQPLPIKQPQQPLTQDQNDSIDATKYLSATPPVVNLSPTPTKSPVKIATPQYVKFDRDKEGDAEPDQDFIKLIFFEQINGVALLSLTNSAKLDTGTISYQPIANMAETIRALNPKNIVALQDTSDKYFLNFPIKLETKIPNVGNGPNGINVYRNDQGGALVSDLTMGAIVIEAINLGPRENIQIETLQSGTIYKTNLGNEES
jgi:hypothetical protein